MTDLFSQEYFRAAQDAIVESVLSSGYYPRPQPGKGGFAFSLAEFLVASGDSLNVEALMGDFVKLLIADDAGETQFHMKDSLDATLREHLTESHPLVREVAAKIETDQRDDEAWEREQDRRDALV